MKKISPASVSPFPSGHRASGVVLDFAALPSPYGIGDVGPSALRWVDRLHAVGQSWWHATQLGNLRCSDSGYACLSTFAGNALLISPDWLVEDGLLSPGDCECVEFPAGSIDYNVVVPFKNWLLQKAWNNFHAGARKDLLAPYKQFRKKQAHWLEDYALFSALRAKFRGTHYREWPAELVRRNSQAIAEARHELNSQIDQLRFSQFLLLRQVQRLKEYAHTKGLRLIGDLPLLVPDESSEVWCNPELFGRDEKYTSELATDLVPICFSSSDRLCPGGDRSALSRVSYRWCADRLRALLAQVDVARVDVRALDAPWHTAGGAPSIKGSEERAHEYLGAVGGLIADGLAMDRTDGFAFRERFHVPETRVLQFGFDGRLDNPHHPQNYTPNSVVYTSLHDDARTRIWFNELPEYQRRAFWKHLKRSSGEDTEVARELIRLAWSSSAAIAMVPLQDLLNLDDDSMNRHNGASGHRRWRCSEDMLSVPALDWLRELTERSNRSTTLSS